MLGAPASVGVLGECLTVFKNTLEDAGGLSAKPPFPQYVDDPEGFARDILGVKFLTKKQIEILRSVVENRVTNCPAGHGVGKTFIAGAVLVLWWVFCVGGIAVTTAPTKRQVERLLWGEVRKMFDKRQWILGGKRMETRVVLSEAAYAYGFTARSYSEDDASGIHDHHLLAIIDEANGVSKEVDNSFKGWIAGAENRGLRIGNPTKDGTPFSTACAKTAIPISCFDHPNVTWAYGPDHEMLPKVAKAIMSDTGEVKERHEWPGWCQVQDVVPGAGPGTPYWEGRVLGLFPSDASTSLVPRSWFKQARARYDSDPETWEREAAEMPWSHGVDVGDGVDDHCMASRRGDLLKHVVVKKTRGDRRDNARCVAMVVSQVDGSPDTGEPKPGAVGVDFRGVGSGVLSTLLGREDDDGKPDGDGPLVEAYGIDFGGRPNTAKRRKLFRNIRGQMLWGLRTRFRKGTIAIAPLGPAIEHRLMEELASIEWEPDLEGRSVPEKKEEVKKKLGFSPDVSDAVAMSFHDRGPMQTKASHW
jgi:hypothetical protein